jgi:hypothetical protein
MMHKKGTTVYSGNQTVPINTLTVWQTFETLNYKAGRRSTAVTTTLEGNKHVTEKN